MFALSPSSSSSRALTRRWGSLSLAILLGAAASLRAEPAVATLYGAAWSPGDAARDGAAELEVLLCAAKLRQANPLAGIVSIGRGRGAFSPAAEIALERVAHMGVPIVRLSQSGPLPAHDGDVFIEAGALSPTDAQRILAECLSRYGALPAAADPARPTKKELSAIHAKLALYQRQFNTHNATLIAMR